MNNFEHYLHDTINFLDKNYKKYQKKKKNICTEYSDGVVF